MTLDQWTAVLTESFQNLWVGIIEFLPSLIVAILIFVLGWIVGAIVGKAIAEILRSLKIDEALRGAGVDKVVNRAGFQLDAGGFIGALVKWFIIAVFLIASLDVLGLTEVNAFLRDVVVVFLPQVIVAVLILLVGAVVAEAIQNVVIASARGAGMRSANFLGTVSKWAVWVFAALAALAELGVATVFLQTLFTGIVVALSLAVGLAFGLGGQEEASRVLKRVREDVVHGE